MEPRIKMSDIAKKIGVSTVSVSKALAEKEGVSDELRRLIKQKAGEMGYIYNSLPHNMRKNRYYNIGILIGSKYLGENSFYWIFYQKLLEALKQTKFLGILEIVTEDDEAACSIPAFFGKVDGLILLGQLSDEYLAMITSKTAYCVFLDFYSEIGKCDCVASNNFLGSYNLTKLLITAGHKKIAFIGSPSATTSILDRYIGFCKAMVEAGLLYEGAIEDRDSKGGLYAEIMLDPGKYTAYVCNNDRLAGRVIRQLGKQGMAVPYDISVVGFDNESEIITSGVSVTSLEVNIGAMCETAVDLLIQHIEIPDYIPRGKSFIDGKIVVKQSIASPKEIY